MTGTEPDFFRDPAIIADPKFYFDMMRSKCPVRQEAHHHTFMVTGFDAAMEVLMNRDGTFSSAASVVGPIPPLPFTAGPAHFREQLEAHRAELPWADHLVCFDGKKHADHRALMVSLLNYKRVLQNEEYLVGLANRFIDGFVDTGACNVVSDYAHATTTYAISDLMGIPVDDRAELLALIGAPPSQLDGDAVHKIGPDPLIFLKERFDGYLKARLENPTDDLMSELVHSTLKDGSRPDFDVLSGLARFLFGAGQDTTSRLIAMGVLILGEKPELQQRLRKEPERIADFIEEVLRYEAPVKVVYRLAMTDTTIGGVEVPAGSMITVCLTAANHDSKHFSNPEDFDIDRPRLRDHMAFSRGAHACAGAPLGRMESRIAIEQLLARTSDIRISEAHHGAVGARRYRFEPTYSFRSLADLFIEFTPA